LRGRLVPDARGTFYARHGDVFAFLSIAAFLIALFL
jgi:hypothetical protein